MMSVSLALLVVCLLAYRADNAVVLGKENLSIPRIANTDSLPCLATCETNSTGDKICTFHVKVNLFAGELGYFEVKQCGTKSNPTLGIEKGVTYIFSQEDESNYYHPLGFSYYPDGAHDDVDELEPTIVPPGSNTICNNTKTCPAPMYFKDGSYLGTYSNNESLIPVEGSDNFGLDTYEPEFFLDALTWNSAAYSVALRFDIVDFTNDIFYFCHIHQFMTGRIKFVDETGAPLNEEGDKPTIPYEYDMPSEYDMSCGTYNLEMFRLPQAECPSKFICNKPDIDTPVGRFADCLDSMNCAMTMGMTSNVHSNSPIALFIHQMIPHHQNAVNMCKALMKSGDIECSEIGSNEDDEKCIMRRLCYGIINGQNHEIQIMRGVLETLDYDEQDDCKVQVLNSSWKHSPLYNIFLLPIVLTVLGVL